MAIFDCSTELMNSFYTVLDIMINIWIPMFMIVTTRDIPIDTYCDILSSFINAMPIDIPIEAPINRKVKIHSPTFRDICVPFGKPTFIHLISYGSGALLIVTPSIGKSGFLHICHKFFQLAGLFFA